MAASRTQKWLRWACSSLIATTHCTTRASERSGAVCDDGLDQDGDGLVDFPADPGCSSPGDGDEHGLAQCDDGLDNDANGDSDWPADRGCASAADPLELELRPGDIFVAEQATASILRVDPVSGSRTTLATGGLLAGPRDLALGRDGSEFTRFEDTLKVGEKSERFTRWCLAGRELVDTLHAVRRYGAIVRDLRSHGLKEAARHFGIATPMTAAHVTPPAIPPSRQRTTRV